ncbi:hypothetical protein V5799_024072 [Amblyomma americanum]|uniref:CAP-Gly domain-containing protein n=1 Tax=Amblyomma americanum TaxID=6943 RepID=A0AAQ4EDD5_AMBAM
MGEARALKRRIADKRNSIPSSYVSQATFYWTIGVEFDNPIGAGDGKFGGKRYFYARNDHAYFLPNSSLLRASDYNSCFRKQNTMGGPTPSPQSKMYTFPHQFSAAKCPFVSALLFSTMAA